MSAMSDKVTWINTPTNNMLHTAEDLVQWIKEGRIAAMAICLVDKENDVISAICADTALFTLLGAVTDMQRTITDKIERG